MAARTALEQQSMPSSSHSGTNPASEPGQNWQATPPASRQAPAGTSATHASMVPRPASNGNSMHTAPEPLQRQTAPMGDEAIECRRTEGTNSTQWAGQFPWSQDIDRANRDFFGNGAFRLNQRQAINASMAGRDCFVLMPTGGGTLPFHCDCSFEIHAAFKSFFRIQKSPDSF